MTSSPRLLMPEAPEEILASSSAEGHPSSVIEPISNSVISSGVFWCCKESIEQSVSGQQCCFKQSKAACNTNVQDEVTLLDDCSRTDLHDTVMCFNMETQGETRVATSERGPLNCEFGNELENASGIESRVGNIGLVEAECKIDCNKRHLSFEGASLNNMPSSGVGILRNSPREVQMASEVLLVSRASSGSTPEKESTCYGSSGNTLVEREVEAVCKERDPECDCPLIERDLDISEEQCDVSNSMQSASCKTILSVVENSLQEGSATVASETVVKKSIKQSITLQPCPAAMIEDNGNMVVPESSMLNILHVTDDSAGITVVSCYVYGCKKKKKLLKPVNPFFWLGLLTNLTKYFEQTNGVTVKELQRAHKVKGSQRRRKQNKFHYSKSPRGAKCVPLSPIHLKVIFRKAAEQNTAKVMPPVGAEALVVKCSHSIDNQPFRKCEDSIDKEVVDKMHMIAPFCCANENLGESEKYAKYPAVNMHPVDRDLEICFISDKAVGN
ncbi:hypothetical protein Ancab_037436 [Ancistrocladus abbreviatus]